MITSSISTPDTIIHGSFLETPIPIDIEDIIPDSPSINEVVEIFTPVPVIEEIEPIKKVKKTMLMKKKIPTPVTPSPSRNSLIPVISSRIPAPVTPSFVPTLLPKATTKSPISAEKPSAKPDSSFLITATMLDSILESKNVSNIADLFPNYKTEKKYKSFFKEMMLEISDIKNSTVSWEEKIELLMSKTSAASWKQAFQIVVNKSIYLVCFHILIIYFSIGQIKIKAKKVDTFSGIVDMLSIKGKIEILNMFVKNYDKDKVLKNDGDYVVELLYGQNLKFAEVKTWFYRNSTILCNSD